MQLGPILSAMRRNKVGAMVIVVQTAITLAILCNGLFIIEQRLAISRRPTGTDEANLFAITNQWLGKPQDLPARVQTDLAALRSLPGVVDAMSMNAYPLTNSGMAEGVTLSADQKDPTTVTAVYFADQHGLATLGLRLIAGRNFTADEIGESGDESGHSPPGAIATRELAEKLFPGEVALGRSFLLQQQDRGTPIIGIVEQLQIPFVAGRAAARHRDATLPDGIGAGGQPRAHRLRQSRLAPGALCREELERASVRRGHAARATGPAQRGRPAVGQPVFRGYRRRRRDVSPVSALVRAAGPPLSAVPHQTADAGAVAPGSGDLEEAHPRAES